MNIYGFGGALLAAVLLTGCPTRMVYFPDGGTGGGGGGGQAGTAGAGTAGSGAAAGAGGMGAAGVSGAAAAGGVAGGAAVGGAGGGGKGGAGGGGAADAGVDSGIGGCLMTQGTLDFEDLATPQSFAVVPLPYVHAGFTLTTDDPEGIEAVGMKATQYLNTTGLIANRTATITLTRSDGKPFSLGGIDLSPYNNVHPGIVYTFVGHKTDGSTVSQDVSLRNAGLGFVPYTLPPSFDDLDSVSWSMNTADTSLYFDNVRYSFCSGG